MTSGEGEDAETTEYYVEWESDRYFFESDFLGTDGQLNDPSISIAVSLTDDSDNTGWYLLEWYGTYDADGAGSGYGIPVVEPEADSDVRPDAGFYTVTETVEDTPDAPQQANGDDIPAYQAAVDAAAVTEDEDGNEKLTADVYTYGKDDVKRLNPRRKKSQNRDILEDVDDEYIDELKELIRE